MEGWRWIAVTSITPEKWVKNFYDLFNNFHTKNLEEDVILIDNSDLIVEEATVKILEIYDVLNNAEQS